MDKSFFQFKGSHLFWLENNGLGIIFFPILVQQSPFLFHPVKKTCAWKGRKYAYERKKHIVLTYKIRQLLKCFLRVVVMAYYKRALNKYAMGMYFLYGFAEVLRQVYFLIHLPQVVFSYGFKAYKDAAAS